MKEIVAANLTETESIKNVYQVPKINVYPYNDII